MTALPPIFVKAKDYKMFKNQLLPEHFTAELKAKANYTLGLNVDTEFQTQSNDDLFDTTLTSLARRIVTVQVSDLLNQHPHILAHTDQIDFAKQSGREQQIRHPHTTADFVVVDYLKQLGYDVQLIYDTSALSAKRTFTTVLYAFFLNADLYPCFKGHALRAVEKFILDKKVIHQKHLQQKIDYNQDGFAKRQQSLRLPYYIVINGQQFGLAFGCHDLLAAQGNVSFKDFCQNVGLAMESKDLAGSNISRMAKWYFEDPERFDTYALGDLTVYPAWTLFVQQVNDLMTTIVSPQYTQDPALTIGSTTNKILNAKRLQYLGLPLQEHRSPLFQNILGNSSFKDLDDEKNPAHTQLKVDGGRCRNNHPTLTKLVGSLCDLDLKGAYTSAMMFLPACLGTPTVLTFNQKSLQQVLRSYRSRLKPYHWTMRITTQQHLSFQQDIIMSYVDYTWKERKCDAEGYRETGELDYKSGSSKIFSRDIIHGMLTSDVLDLIEHTWTTAAQEEFFQKCQVDSLLFYDPKCEMKEVSAFVDHALKHDVKKPLAGWHSVPLKQMGIENFREERKKHLKGTPQNTLFKLVGNTAYGAIVSHFFLAQNPITANNITAHIRVAVYLAEKALGIKQTITDGGVFNLNEVLIPKLKGKIFTNKLFNANHLSKRELNHTLNLKRTGLGGHTWQIKGNSPQQLQIFCDDRELTLKEAETLVNTLCLQHVKQTFPTMPLLQNPDIEFEMKAFYNTATLHGSSNYAFWYKDTLHAVKMRGYERKRHDGFTLDENNNLIKDPTYHDNMSPAQWMHHALHQNPQAVPLPTSFLKNSILKTGDYVNSYDRRPDSPIKPGDNLKKMGCPKWTSINQFTYQTKSQYDNWNKVAQQLLRKYHLSFELFFLKDNRINMIDMVDAIHKLIEKGVGINSKKEILDHFDPHDHLCRICHRNSSILKMKQARETMTKRISNFYYMSEQDVFDLNNQPEDLEEVDEFDLK